MATPAETPSPPTKTPVVPTNTPMAPPATPGKSTARDTVPRTPSSATARPPATPGSSHIGSPFPPTPGSTIKACTAEASEMKLIPARTATCSVCNNKNKTDLMLRCCGCVWQICHPCQVQRKKAGTSLVHGSTSPSLSMSLSRTRGPSKRHSILPLTASPAPPIFARDTSVLRDVKMASPAPEVTTKGKGKEKAAPVPAKAGKKRAAKPKASKPVVDDESSGDDFVPDPASPTSKKRRRITDTPTATTEREHRKTSSNSAPSTYVAPASPTSSIDSAELAASVGRPLSSLNAAETMQMWGVDVTQPGRVQELFEAAGINGEGNRWQEHLLARSEPVMSSRVAVIPETVRRMADKTPRLTAVDKVNLRNAAAIAQHTPPPPVELTVRGLASAEAIKHQLAHPSLSVDDKNELFNAVKEAATSWAHRTYKKLPAALQGTVAKGLDMRMDHVDGAWTAKLVEVCAKAAARKVREFGEREGDLEGGEGGEEGEEM